MGIEEVVKELKRIKGISNVNILNEEEKKELLKFKENAFVVEALKKRYTLAFSKSDLRKDELRKLGKLHLIKISHLENAILPGFEMHKQLGKNMDLGKKDVTVLVGLEEITGAIEKVKEEPVEEGFIFEGRETENLKAIYASPAPELKIDYSELFAYLNTRPTNILYEYEFSSKEVEKEDVLNYGVLERINKARKMEKTISAADKSDYIPEGFTAQQLEQFNLFRKLSFGAELNKILYDIGFS